MFDTKHTRPRLDFHGLARIAADVIEVRHDACETSSTGCIPPFPHPDDTVLVVLDLIGAQPSEGLVLTVGTERAHLPALEVQLAELLRKVRCASKSWKSFGRCVRCGEVGFDAANPPPVFKCAECADTHFEIVQVEGGAAESRSAASGCGCASHGHLLNRIEDGLRAREDAHRSDGQKDVALGFRRARGLVAAIRGEVRS